MVVSGFCVVVVDIAEGGIIIGIGKEERCRRLSSGRP